MSKSRIVREKLIPLIKRCKGWENGIKILDAYFIVFGSEIPQKPAMKFYAKERMRILLGQVRREENLQDIVLYKNRFFVPTEGVVVKNKTTRNIKQADTTIGQTVKMVQKTTPNLPTADKIEVAETMRKAMVVMANRMKKVVRDEKEG